MSEEELRAHLKKMEKNKEELKFQEQRCILRLNSAFFSEIQST